MNDKVQEKIIKWVLQTTFRNELEAQQCQINQLENKLLETKAKQEKINNCFDGINESFKKLFSEFFDGGKSYLKMEE